MEKLIYALWGRAGEDRAALNERLREGVPQLVELPNVHGARLNLQDAHVARVKGFFFSRHF